MVRDQSLRRVRPVMRNGRGMMRGSRVRLIMRRWSMCSSAGAVGLGIMSVLVSSDPVIVRSLGVSGMGSGVGVAATSRAMGLCSIQMCVSSEGVVVRIAGRVVRCVRSCNGLVGVRTNGVRRAMKTSLLNMSGVLLVVEGRLVVVVLGSDLVTVLGMSMTSVGVGMTSITVSAGGVEMSVRS